VVCAYYVLSDYVIFAIHLSRPLLQVQAVSSAFSSLKQSIYPFLMVWVSSFSSTHKNRNIILYFVGTFHSFCLYTWGGNTKFLLYRYTLYNSYDCGVLLTFDMPVDRMMNLTEAAAVTFWVLLQRRPHPVHRLHP